MHLKQDLLYFQGVCFLKKEMIASYLSGATKKEKKKGMQISE